MIITLTKEQLEKCNKFSYECAKNQQQIEFGQSDTIPRSIKEIGRDNMIGKIAEVAFSNMLNDRYGLIVPLDFEYYPRGKWDVQDAVINNWRIDVKCTRQGGRWMLIEWSKLNFRQKDNDLSHLFVMASVMWNREMDIPTGKVDLIGSASILRLKQGISTTHVLYKGDCIPNTHMKLQSDNFGIKFENLEHNWDKVIGYITKHNPPCLNNYPNPYIN